MQLNQWVGRTTPYGQVISAWPMVAGWVLLEVCYAPGRSILVRLNTKKEGAI